MGNPYTTVSISGYNTNPPSDDGSTTEANRLTWAKHKTKIGDPIKTAVEAIDTNVLAAFAKIVGGGGVTSAAISYAVLSADQGKLVRASAAGITITAPDATDVGSPFVFGVLNDSTGDITLDGNGAQTINGDASAVIGPNEGGLCVTDGSNFFVIGLTRRTQVQPQGRLTPTTATPVIAADVSAGTAVYYTPFNGNLVPIPDGTLFTVREFSELTLTLHSNHVGNGIYDVFAFDNSGTITIGTGPVWNTVTAGSCARGTGAATTELVRLKGLWVNNVAMTARNGATTYSVSAKCAVYLGSILIDGSAGQVSCLVAYGQSRKHGVWNAYNRKPVILRAGDITASWTYDTATIRQSRGTAGNTAAIFCGLAEEWAAIEFSQYIGTTTTDGQTIELQVGIGVNSTTVFSGRTGKIGPVIWNSTTTDAGTQTDIATAKHKLIPSLGLNNVNSLENTVGKGATSATYYGGQDDMEMTVEYLA